MSFSVAGVLLAAGAGRRMGLPKSQLRHPDGVSYLDRAVGVLLDGGCATVTVVLGASAEVAISLLDEAGWSEDPRVSVVVGTDWDEGMGASLRHGLTALAEGLLEPDAAVVTLVDLPDITAGVVVRLLDGAVGPDPLARASYDGVPGHPVLLGRLHWRGVVEAAVGDHGARDFLAGREVRFVECADLATGRDVDHPGDLT